MTDERYEDFLGELPQFAPDQRQGTFLKVIGPGGPVKKMFVDQHLQKVEIANVTKGWPASAPDLGFLQRAMVKLISLGKMDPRSTHDVRALISWAVQRIKRVTVAKEDYGVYVRFWTKDDHGYYEHGFPVHFPKEQSRESAGS